MNIGNTDRLPLRRGIALALALSLVLSQVSGQSATAASLEWYEYKVVSYSKVTTNYVNYSQTIASCSNVPVTPTGTCDISRTRTANKTLFTSVGLSVSKVSASIGRGTSTTVSLSVQCTSAPGYKKMDAYPKGTLYKVKVRKRTYDAYNHLVRTSYKTSRFFVPTGVRCVSHN